MPNIFGNYGIRRLIDQQLRFFRSGGNDAAVFLRTKNFTDQGYDFAEMGLAFTPTATGGFIPGFTDTLIDPPATIRTVSMHNLGMANQAGIALRQGAKDVMISHTFVKARQLQLNYAESRQVFEDPTVVGLVIGKNNSIVLGIESVFPDYAYGEIIAWHLLCNFPEVLPNI